MFPISISGRIRIKDTVSFSAQAIEDEIASTLMVRGIPVDYRPDGGFRFRLSIFRLFGWTEFQGISSGTVRCIECPEALHISYRLRFFHLALLVSALLLFCRWLDTKYSPIHIPIKYYIAVWALMICAYMFFALLEFRRFLRLCVAESAERVFYWRKLQAPDDVTDDNE